MIYLALPAVFVLGVVVGAVALIAGVSWISGAWEHNGYAILQSEREAA